VVGSAARHQGSGFAALCQNGAVTQPVPLDAPPAMGVPPARPRRWVVITTIVWGVILVVGFGWALRNGGPTAREQTTVVQAQPVVDLAAVRIAGAASADGNAIVAISGFERVAECSVTLLRSGERYQRVVTAVVTPGTEAALIQRVADRLPADYQATVAGTPARLVGDAGLWVRLGGSVTAIPGEVRFVADTGNCRPTGDLSELTAPVGHDPAALDPVGRGLLQNALSRVGVPDGQWSGYRAACPGGGYLSTVEAVAVDDGNAEPLDKVLADLGTTVVATSHLFAYATGATGVAVRVGDGQVVATATTGCPAQ
jgi:hypothetical protein